MFVNHLSENRTYEGKRPKKWDKKKDNDKHNLDTNNLDFNNFKGNYFWYKTEKFQDPVTGCHL